MFIKFQQLIVIAYNNIRIRRYIGVGKFVIVRIKVYSIKFVIYRRKFNIFCSYHPTQ